MAKKPPSDPDEGIRRFLTDFRSDHDRRSFDERRVGGRRSKADTVDDERREPDDRRDMYDRRETLLDRRRGTSESFIREQIEWIRQALLNAETAVACPRCEGDLLLGPTVKRASKFVREVHCTACRHRAVITDVPEDSVEGDSGVAE
jgi:DNA-directed RNA polymerase subunit RPC12/RpoP